MNRKLIKIGLIIALIFVTTLDARRYYVRTSGDDRNDGLTPETAWRTIGRATEEMGIGPGDTVIIGRGTYPGAVKISQSGDEGRPITYYGDFEGHFVPDGPGEIYIDNWSNDKYLIVLKEAEHVRIRGLTVRWGQYGGIKIRDSEGIVVDSCSFVWNGKYGIYCSKSEDVIIKGNTVKGGSIAGFYLSECGEVNEVSFNVVDNCTRGIVLKKSEAVSVSNNTLKNCDRNGIYASESEVSRIVSNRIFNIWNSHGIYLNNVRCNSIAVNQIYRCGGSGIYCYSNDPDEDKYTVGYVRDNEIYTTWNGSGIYIFCQNVDRISNNLIHDTDESGIFIEGGDRYIVNHVDSNTVYGTWREGIVFSKTLDVKSIKSNVIYRVSKGISWKASSHHSVENFSRNIIHSNWEGGIRIENLYNTVIENNLIYGNPYWECYGIWIESNGGKSIDIKNNTIYRAGSIGIYGKDVRGSWRNNIVYGHHRYGIYGDGIFRVLDSYNCSFGNYINWGGRARPGPGSFSDDPLFVDPDGADNVLGGNNWEDDDLHVKSIYGSYHFGAWIPDDVHSPCIDAGHPGDGYSLEPEDNGNRINIGCYGNTPEASLSGPMGGEMVYHNFPLDVWVMIGVPLIPEDGDPLKVYGDDFGGGMPDGTWSCIRWACEDSVSEYYEYGDGTPYQPPDCYPGISHFVWQNTGSPVDVDVQGEELGVPCTLDVAQAPSVDWYPPAPGFNMFANPYPYTIDWSNSYLLKYSEDRVERLSLWEAASRGYVSQYAYLWDHKNGDYEIIVPQRGILDTISIWRGFWFIQLDSVTNLKLVIPNREVPTITPLPVVPFFCLGKSVSSSPEELRLENKVLRKLSLISTRFSLKKATISQSWKWFLKLGVRSTDGMLRDYENGIGVDEGSKDGLDGWDAYDFRGMDRYGNFVQLVFVGPENRPLAYDFRGDFDREKTWQFKIIVNKKNLRKDFFLLFPHVRLVPGHIDFKILDRERRIIVNGLRDKRYTEITLHDSVETFYITAYKKQDKEPPEFSYNVTCEGNGRFVGLYVIPSEPLDTIWAEVDGEVFALRELPSVEGIYYSYLNIPVGSYDIEIKGVDLNGNRGRERISIYKVLSSTKMPVVSSGSEMMISFPEPPGHELVISQGNIDVDIPHGFEILYKPLYIGPEEIEFSFPAILTIESPISQGGYLYRYRNGRWEFISDAGEKNYLNGGGIYCILRKSKSVDKQGSVSIASEFRLFEPYPNPFNICTKIKYSLKEPGNVEVAIYDVLGKKIRVLREGFESSGYHIVSWDGRNSLGQEVSSGIYFLKIEAESVEGEFYSGTKKLVLLK